MLYTAGKSLAWLGAGYDVSHTTVATALRRHGLQLRAGPGWVNPAASRASWQMLRTVSAAGIQE
jgi:hypothetical protein